MTDATATPALPRRLPKGEFIALMGVIFATVAFSIDAMLPALPEIADDLSPSEPNRAQLVLTSFVFGMGIGTLFAGPLSDAFGRKRVIVAGAALYIAGALLAYAAPSLELILAARMLQGLGAAGPRVVSLAMVRDLYSGRQMAQIVSYAMLVFTLFPAVAPLIGSFIILGFGWRSIFLAFFLFSVLSVGWLSARQPETLTRAARVPLSPGPLRAAILEVLAHRQMQFSIVVQTAVFTALFGSLSSVQMVFDQTYGLGSSFPYWFAAVALLSAPAAPINGVLVMRLGMRPMIRAALVVQCALSLLAATLMATGIAAGYEHFVYFLWTTSVFATAAFTIGNLNALALEPLGHVAGMASSVMGALSTVGGAIGGALIGQLFDGTAVPIALSVMAVVGVAALIMTRMPREQV